MLRGEPTGERHGWGCSSARWACSVMKLPEPVIDLPRAGSRAGAVRVRVSRRRCPACSGRGYLDHIDPFKKVQYEHCPSCLTKWELAEDEVLALNG